MGRKLKGASALSLAATMMMALIGADGSQAIAGVSDAALEASGTAQVEATPAVTFVSEPMVQPIPEPKPEQDFEAPAARSLSELVDAHPVPGMLDEDLRCLAGAIYFESKGESLAGQLAVGRVVVARAESGSFPSSYCGVVYQRSQFSFVRGGRMPAINTGSRAWLRAKKLAVIAHENAWNSDAEGALYFHANYVAPRWSNKMSRLARIDNHVFYR